jgi:hypothetical protein
MKYVKQTTSGPGRAAWESPRVTTALFCGFSTQSKKINDLEDQENKAENIKLTTSVIHCIIARYKDQINTKVVPMLYLFNKKSLYVFNLQAFIQFMCDPRRSRTPNLLIRSQTLYPIELWDLRI